MSTNYSDFKVALERYKDALHNLNSNHVEVFEENLLEILLTRDKLQCFIEKSTEDDIFIQIEVFQLDKLLRQHASVFSKSEALKEWKQYVQPPKSSWWWYFMDVQDESKWLWSALTVTSLTVSLSLLLDISPRFFTGGPDLLGSFTIISQSILTLLAAGGALSQAGKNAIENLLESRGIDKKYWHEAKFAFSAGLVLILLSVHTNLPHFSRLYSHWGKQIQIEEEGWSSARNSFERAIKLDPDNIEAHFRLGLLYEDLPDIEQAKNHYRIAAQENLPEAFNNLARLYLLEGSHVEAIQLLLRLESLVSSNNSNDPDVVYGLRKNLGWARLEQKRYSEALTQLQEAIRIDPNRASAYCLLAQVYESQGSSYAHQAWENCEIHFSVTTLPEEDKWINLARNYLKSNP